ncbi:MAG: hypothetical protein AAFX06_26570 [Planctomycetota bacterium]
MKFIVALVVLVWLGLNCHADTALPLLSGFDSARLAKCYPIRDTDSAGEAAKLIYRLRKANPNTLKKLATALPKEIGSATVGDVFEVEGKLEKIRQYEVPGDLSDYLDLDQFQELVFSESPLGDVSLLVPPLDGKASREDRVASTAMLLYQDDKRVVFAAGDAAWFPTLASNEGIRLLTSAGVDASGIAAAATRNRRKLEAADGETFYSMLGATTQLVTGESLPEPKPLEPIALLEFPEEHHGDWIRMRAATVRITKVNVTDETRRQQLGQDHYFQIDSSGDLGKTMVKLKRPEGEPIEMSGKYPISLVSLRLPEFLESEFESEQTVVQMISAPVRIDGFFYRLWSYRNEFIDQRGGGSQIGPLIVVARWQRIEPPRGDDGGIALLGYLMAGGVILAIVSTFIWSRRNAVVDAKLREKQREIDVIWAKRRQAESTRTSTSR